VLQFVEDLGDSYAGVLSKSQPNSTFLLGETVRLDGSSAVYMFYVAFDSLAGPQVRFIHQNTTVYCGGLTAVTEATSIALRNGPVVTQSSEGYADLQAGTGATGGSAASGEGKQDKAPVWFIIVAVVASATPNFTNMLHFAKSFSCFMLALLFTRLASTSLAPAEVLSCRDLPSCGDIAMVRIAVVVLPCPISTI
jgi:hypothetical protein